MLAEPRSRVKYSVNPRGLDWSNDDSKLGQKLLEKMGWKKGSALGLKENGNPEPIKVSAKSDRRGVGCSVKNADNWIAHQDDFSSILAGLNEGSSSQSIDEESSSSFSLEQRSKNSRSRVHYQKFAKGKDLSRYETADLQSIFGQRQKQETTSRCDSPVEPQTADEEESNRSFGVITVTSSTSIDSYFAQKMAEVKQRLALVSGSAVTKAGDDNRSDDVKSTVEEAQIVCADNERKRKKKKRRHDVEDDSKISGIDEMQPKKSKKKTKQEIESSVNNFNDNDEDSSEGQKKKRKKSKKRKMDVEVSNDSVAEADCCSAVLNTVTSSNPLCETLVDDVSLGESRVHKKSKKRSKNVDRQQQCEAETNADNVDVSLIDTKKEKFKNKHVCELQKEQKLEDCRPVEKKKKKKSKNVDRC